MRGIVVTVLSYIKYIPIFLDLQLVLFLHQCQLYLFGLYQVLKIIFLYGLVICS